MNQRCVPSALVLLVFAACSTASAPPVPPRPVVMTKAAQAALTPAAVRDDLERGNRRFVAGEPLDRDLLAQVAATAQGQHPKAAILSCIDSRVPVEMIFDQGIGDLFGVRIAGNVETDAGLGSLEYASGAAGAKLVVVLGHTSCGAVKGAIDREHVAHLGLANLDALLEELAPAVRAAAAGEPEPTVENAAFVDRVAAENVRLTIADIRAKSPALARLEREGAIRIIGAIYDVATGRVFWLDPDGPQMSPPPRSW